MRKYTYYIDEDGFDTLVRDCYGAEQLSPHAPAWQKAAEYYWREIYLGQGLNCLRQITLEEARQYLTRWCLDPALAQEFTGP